MFLYMKLGMVPWVHVVMKNEEQLGYSGYTVMNNLQILLYLESTEAPPCSTIVVAVVLYQSSGLVMFSLIASWSMKDR